MSEEMDYDEFARDLAAAAAKQLAKVLKAGRSITVDDINTLQDCTSLYSPYTFDTVISELVTTHKLRVAGNVTLFRQPKTKKPQS